MVGFWSIFYLICTGATVSVALASTRIDVQKMAAVMLSSWIVSNGLVKILGFDATPYAMPAFDFLWAAYVCGVYARSGKKWLIPLIALFVATLAAHVAYHARIVLDGAIDAHQYYLLLNILFLLQLITIAVKGARHVAWTRAIDFLLGVHPHNHSSDHSK